MSIQEARILIHLQVYVKTRTQQPQLLFNFNVSYRPLPSKSKDESCSVNASGQDVDEYDTELFETIDLLGGLSEGKFIINWDHDWILT